MPITITKAGALAAIRVIANRDATIPAGVDETATFLFDAASEMVTQAVSKSIDIPDSIQDVATIRLFGFLWDNDPSLSRGLQNAWNLSGAGSILAPYRRKGSAIIGAVGATTAATSPGGGLPSPVGQDGKFLTVVDDAAAWEVVAPGQISAADIFRILGLLNGRDGDLVNIFSRDGEQVGTISPTNAVIAGLNVATQDAGFILTIGSDRLPLWRFLAPQDVLRGLPDRSGAGGRVLTLTSDGSALEWTAKGSATVNTAAVFDALPSTGKVANAVLQIADAAQKAFKFSSPSVLVLSGLPTTNRTAGRVLAVASDGASVEWAVVAGGMGAVPQALLDQVNQVEQKTDAMTIDEHWLAIVDADAITSFRWYIGSSFPPSAGNLNRPAQTRTRSNTTGFLQLWIPENDVSTFERGLYRFHVIQQDGSNEQIINFTDVVTVANAQPLLGFRVFRHDVDLSGATVDNRYTLSVQRAVSLVTFRSLLERSSVLSGLPGKHNQANHLLAVTPDETDVLWARPSTVVLNGMPSISAANEHHYLRVNEDANNIEWADPSGLVIGGLPALTDNAGKWLTVGEDADALFWYDPTDAVFSGMPDPDAQGGKILALNSGETALEWVDKPAGGNTPSGGGFTRTVLFTGSLTTSGAGTNEDPRKFTSNYSENVGATWIQHMKDYIMNNWADGQMVKTVTISNASLTSHVAQFQLDCPISMNAKNMGAIRTANRQYQLMGSAFAYDVFGTLSPNPNPTPIMLSTRLQFSTDASNNIGNIRWAMRFGIVRDGGGAPTPIVALTKVGSFELVGLS